MGVEMDVEKGLLVSLESNTLNIIECQTILQLLVKKGIVTREEVLATREIVSNQYKYKDVLDEISKKQNDLADDNKFKNEMTKKFSGEKYDNDFLQSYLNKMQRKE